MRRLVEPKVAPIIDGGETLVGALGIMHAVITLPAGHQRRDHDLGADCQRLAHEIFRKVRSRLHKAAVPHTPQAPIATRAAFFPMRGHSTERMRGSAPGPAKVATRMVLLRMANENTRSRGLLVNCLAGR